MEDTLRIASKTDNSTPASDGNIPLDIIETSVATLERWLDQMGKTLDPEPKARATALLCKILWDARKAKAKPDLGDYLKLVVG
ncbi:hypothetical protein [Rhodospirillum sp. A1_3_36]|uniref:hypothetical protein n=1 Tax=Rhodospirillum sp. A1_3_36 TaxID=3391666 RepID=UPI0039A476FF